MITEDEKKLIRAVTLGEVSHEAFGMQFRPGVADKEQFILELWNSASHARSESDLADVIVIASVWGVSKMHLEVLRSILKADWHHKHEDIVLALDKLRDAACVEDFYAVATTQYPYLDYDEFYSLQRSAIWALGNVGTSEALERLRYLTASAIPKIAGYAKEQVDRIESGAIDWKPAMP